MNKLVIIIIFSGLLLSCSHNRLLMSYGTKQKYLIYGDSSLVNGNVTFKIKNCVFKFKGIDFENELSKQREKDLSSDYNSLKIKHINGDHKLLITYTGNGLNLNDSIKVTFPLDYTIGITLDKLVQSGKFHLTCSNNYIHYIEYIYWEPQYQGTIFSKWLINEKTVFEIVHGFAD